MEGISIINYFVYILSLKVSFKWFFVKIIFFDKLSVWFNIVN